MILKYPKLPVFSGTLNMLINFLKSSIHTKVVRVITKRRNGGKFCKSIRKKLNGENIQNRQRQERNKKKQKSKMRQHIRYFFFLKNEKTGKPTIQKNKK